VSGGVSSQAARADSGAAGAITNGEGLRTMRLARRRRSRGQALTEFAIIVPVLLTLVGVAIDVSRLYVTWINLEAAARDAAQYVASDPGYTTTGGYYDSTDTANYCSAFPCTTAPSTDAKTVVDKEVGVSFTKSSSQTTCTTPKVWAVLASPSTDSSTGGSNAYPMASTQVTACAPFTTLFPYPFFTQGGSWIIHVDKTFKVLVGR
jgi:Flp pilus assembly protein TadG